MKLILKIDAKLFRADFLYFHNHLQGVPFPVLAGMVLILIDNLKIQ